MELLIAAALGYLLGSLPFAVIVSRAFGLADPRSFGSGNPGATNVLRTGNKAAALLTLLGDAAKGWLAMLIATKVGAGETAVALAGLAAFLGHVFPFTLGFKGGKGVATAVGVLLGFSVPLAGIAIGLWIAVAAITRYSSLAALVAAGAAPLIAGLLVGRIQVVLPVTIISAVLILRHKGNIQKLLAGTESRLGGNRSKGSKKTVQEN
jgi:glycerol-3-phosphate acyltransferase PlsY